MIQEWVESKGRWRKCEATVYPRCYATCLNGVVTCVLLFLTWQWHSTASGGSMFCQAELSLPQMIKLVAKQQLSAVCQSEAVACTGQKKEKYP